MKATRAPKRKRRAAKYTTLRKALIQRRQDLLGQLHGGIADSRAGAVGTGYNDIADRASDAFYSELAAGFAELASADLRMVDNAIRKIDAGAYGRCESCGRPIPVARLRALPFAELCIECKREEELADETGG